MQPKSNTFFKCVFFLRFKEYLKLRCRSDVITQCTYLYTVFKCFLYKLQNSPSTLLPQHPILLIPFSFAFYYLNTFLIGNLLSQYLLPQHFLPQHPITLVPYFLNTFYLSTLLSQYLLPQQLLAPCQFSTLRPQHPITLALHYFITP